MTKGSQPYMELIESVKRAEVPGGLDHGEMKRLLAIAPYIDVPGTYSDGRQYNFEWEREWRHVGDVRFDVADVRFIIAPENEHETIYFYLPASLIG